MQTKQAKVTVGSVLQNMISDLCSMKHAFSADVSVAGIESGRQNYLLQRPSFLAAYWRIQSVQPVVQLEMYQVISSATPVPLQNLLQILQCYCSITTCLTALF